MSGIFSHFRLYRRSLAVRFFVGLSIILQGYCCSPDRYASVASPVAYFVYFNAAQTFRVQDIRRMLKPCDMWLSYSGMFTAK